MRCGKYKWKGYSKFTEAKISSLDINLQILFSIWLVKLIDWLLCSRLRAKFINEFFMSTSGVRCRHKFTFAADINI